VRAVRSGIGRRGTGPALAMKLPFPTLVAVLSYSTPVAGPFPAASSLWARRAEAGLQKEEGETCRVLCLCGKQSKLALELYSPPAVAPSAAGPTLIAITLRGIGRRGLDVATNEIK
jgi:hypothetical protein